MHGTITDSSTPHLGSRLAGALLACLASTACGPAPEQDLADEEVTDAAMSPNLSLLDEIEVTVASAPVRASGAPVGEIVGAQARGARGRVTAGPAVVAGAVRWRIDFASGVDGWVFQPYLARRTVEKWHPGHYSAVLGDRPLRASDLPTPKLRGVQKIYEWRTLEPTKGNYDFSAIEADLALVASKDRYLVAQISYKTFGRGNVAVPAYVASGAREFGPNRVYESTTGATCGSIWIPEVAARYQALLRALGARFDADPHFEMVNLPETALGPRDSPADPHGMNYLGSLGYTRERFVAAIEGNMDALAAAFPRSVKVQYVNWGPVEELAAYAESVGVGIGGPDVHPDRGAIPSYDLHPRYSGVIPNQGAVQYPDYYVVPKQPASGLVDPRDTYRFARDELGLNYLMWSTGPADGFARVVSMLDAPSFPADPAGGLPAARPASMGR